MKPQWICICFGLLLSMAIPIAAHAQGAQAPPPIYTGSFGAGLALTRGNSDTLNFNLTFDLVRDPKKRNVFKANALYLRSSAEGFKTGDRFAFGIRDEFNLSPKNFLYGAFSYLRDPFQDLSYLLNPNGGFGHRLYHTERATFSLSGGAGVVWEKDTGLDVRTSGTLNAGQNFTYKLSETSSINQVFSALWKTSDFNDALYHVSVALVSSITKRAQVKVEFSDTYKNVTPNPTIQSNDTAFITSFLYKF